MPSFAIPKFTVLLEPLWVSAVFLLLSTDPTLDDTLLNGWLIGRCSRIYEKIFDFQDRLSLRKFFA